MAGPAITNRFIASINLTNDQSSFFELPRDLVYAQLELRFRAQVTIAGGTTNGTLVDENPMSYIRRVRIEGAGGLQSGVLLKDLKGIHAFRRAHAHGQIEPNAVPLLSAGAGGPTNVSCIIPIYFAIPHPKSPSELQLITSLRPQEFQNLRLEIQAGNALDFVNGGDRTVTVTGGVVDVYAKQAVNLIMAPPWRYIEQFMFRESTSAVATERPFTNQYQTGRIYRDLMYRVTNEVANARQPVDDTLGDMKLRIGITEILRYQDFREYVEEYKRDYDVQQAANPAGLNPLGSRDNPIIGHYFFDFHKKGRFEGFLDTTRFPVNGLTLNPVFDIDIATARQIDAVVGYIQVIPGTRRTAGPGGGRTPAMVAAR